MANQLMSADELDAAMRCYLGGEPEEPGMMPVGMAERLVARYGTRAASIKQQLDEVLDLVGTFPMGDGYPGLKELGDAVARWLASKTPHFAEVTRAKMANYFTYSWR